MERAYRSNKRAVEAGTRGGGARFGGETDLGIAAMTDQKTDQKKDNKAPPPVLSGAPDRALELKVKKHPEDEDAKVDLGSDESMDASDPISTTQPGSSEPAPSSGYPEKKTGD
jgi:hypothetical protein